MGSEANQGLKQGPRLVRTQGEGQAGQRPRLLPLLRRSQREETGPLASLAFSLRSNQPGALLQSLVCFAAHGLNMSRIESRPSKREMGEYIFFVDLMLPAEGAEPLRLALDQLRPLCEHLALFGTYPLDTQSPEDEAGELSP
ncbi:MAG: hypothetical protein ACK40D_02345, partial [Cyanobacteriota bacterium]